MKRAAPDPKATSNLLYVLACVLLAGSVVGLLVQKPSSAQAQAKAKKTERDERKKTADALAKAAADHAAVASMTWSDEPSVMKGRIVDLTSSLATRRGVKWVRLTPPAKSTLDGTLEQYPFMLVVEGPFVKVAALERDLEDPQNRLAINSFQATSSNTESDAVSASIGFVAHRVAPEESVVKKK